MTEFLGSTLKAHTDAFDHLVERTDAALSHPKTIEGLGELATSLRQANSELIFPNITDGRVEVPASKRESNGAVLLPLFNGDHGALKTTGVGETLLRPTPRREAWLHQKFMDYDSTLDAANLIDREHALFVEGLHNITLSQVRIYNGMTLRGSRNILRNTPSLYSSRPLILTSSIVARGDTAFIGHVVAHELSHAEDREKEETQSTPDGDVESELRAYHVGHTILRAYYPSLTRHMKKQYKQTLRVEQLRTQYTNPATPFKTTPVLTKKLKDIGILE